MTLGPALILLALFENANNKLARFFIVFGKVPFFYYIIHFYLIHLLCMGIFFAQGFGWNESLDPAAPLIMYFRPVVFGIELWAVYLVWIGVIAALYFPCKWFGNFKKRRRDWWLRYC